MSRGVVAALTSRDDTTTRALLACGMAAGPLYVVVALLQMMIRPGFDVTRHPLSLLSNGSLGWIQVANFLVTGALLIAGALGARRALRSGRGRTWGPLLLALYGLGLIGAGIFSADPALGFPPGTPEVTSVSSVGLLHFVAGAIGFAGFVSACFVFASRYRALQQPGWALCSIITGVLFLAAFLGIASGAKGGVSLVFAIAAVLGFVWISAVLGRVRAEVAR